MGKLAAPLGAVMALVLAPLSASAVTITAGNAYTFNDTIAPGGQVVFDFEVGDDLDVDVFALSASGNNGGDDVANVTFAYSTVTGDTFSQVFVFGSSAAAVDSVPSFGPWSAGDSFSFTFDDGIDLPVSLTLSFTTIAPVPVPASGLMLLGAVAGAAALRRRKKAA